MSHPQTIRLSQIDGALPNLALMKLAHWHRARGDQVHFTRQIERELFEPDYDRVYASAIFRFSQERIEQFRREWPGAIVSGTGVADDGGIAVEEVIGQAEWGYEHYDYSFYPEFTESIGFLSRGCRLGCKFCLVRQKEGAAISVNTVNDVWRGGKAPRKLHLLDNDFFGNPQWRERVKEIREGGFRVCLSQGINVRLIDDESAAALATIEYRDGTFQKRRLYTAWDNLGDEDIFFRGVDRLEAAGIPPKHLMAYMLCGYDPQETWDRIWRRFHRMTERGIAPYPMVFDKARKDLVAFQRWVVTGLYRIVPWNEYQRGTKSRESEEAFLRLQAMGVGS